MTTDGHRRLSSRLKPQLLYEVGANLSLWGRESEEPWGEWELELPVGEEAKGLSRPGGKGGSHAGSGSLEVGGRRVALAWDFSLVVVRRQQVTRALEREFKKVVIRWGWMALPNCWPAFCSGTRLSGSAGIVFFTSLNFYSNEMR